MNPANEAWYGLPFEDLDCRHWLPYLTESELKQQSPKLIGALDDQYVTDWALEPYNKEVA